MAMPKRKHEHVINLYVSYVVKSQLETLAAERGESIASVIRRAFKVAIPILQRMWEVEELIIRQQCELLKEPPSCSSKLGKQGN